MLKTYLITGKIGSNSLVSKKIDIGLDKHYISYKVFDENNNRVYVAGKAIIEASEDGITYGSVHDGTIDLSNTYYQRPSIRGSIERVRCSFDSTAQSLTDHRIDIIIRSKL